MGLFNLWNEGKDKKSSCTGRVIGEISPNNARRTTEIAEWKIGDRIDGLYEVHNIRRGGMGIVFLCYDHDSKEPLAIKTLQDKYFNDKGAIGRFTWEAETWVRLEKHKNIVSAYFVRNISGKPYIFLELVPGDEIYGSDLTGWIWGDGFDLNTALSFSIQFCLGMEHAERKFKEMGKPFVHRDIKPGNIMVTKDKVVKVTDFGLVKTFIGLERDINDRNTKDDATSEEKYRFSKIGSICGTPPYMSPEQCKGEIEIDTRSDIYSFGCVIYEMLVRVPPFEGPHFDNYRAQHIKVEPRAPIEFNSDIPDKLNTLVMKCLKKKPTERYQNFKNLREELSEIYFQQTGYRLKIDETPDELEAWEHNNKGISFHALGRYDEALNECKQAIKMDPYNGKFHYNLALALYGKGLLDNAIQVSKDALRLEPDYSNIYNALGVALKDKGLIDNAIDEFKKAVKLRPKDVFARNNLAISLKEKGLYDEAILKFRETLKIKPDYADCHYNLGNTLSEKNLFEEAILEYEEALKLNSYSTKYYIGLGNAFNNISRYVDAIQSYDKAIELSPKDPTCWNNKGESLKSLNRLNEAISYFDKSIYLDDRNAIAWANKGSCLENMGQVTKAIECYDKAIAFGHEQTDDIWNIKGCIFENLQRFEDAIYCFDKAVEINPKHISAWTNKGNAFDAQGHIDEAIRCYDKAIESDAHWYSAWYDKGVCLMNMRNNEEAIYCFSESIRFFEESLKGNPRYAAAWLNKALCEEKVKRFYDARNSYKNFIDVAPSEYERHVVYAQQRLAELNSN